MSNDFRKLAHEAESRALNSPNGSVESANGYFDRGAYLEKDIRAGGSPYDWSSVATAYKHAAGQFAEASKRAKYVGDKAKEIDYRLRAKYVRELSAEANARHKAASTKRKKKHTHPKAHERLARLKAYLAK